MFRVLTFEACHGGGWPGTLCGPRRRSFATSHKPYRPWQAGTGGRSSGRPWYIVGFDAQWNRKPV